MIANLTTYRCHWCGAKIRTPWRSKKQPLDRCPMCGGIMIQRDLPKRDEQLNYGQEEDSREH